MKLTELYAAMTIVGLRPWGGKRAKHSTQTQVVGDFKGIAKDIDKVLPKKRMKALKFWKQKPAQ